MATDSFARLTRSRWAGVIAIGLLLSGTAHAEPVTAVRLSGSSANRVDLVILGDGYTAADLATGKYANDVEAFVQQIFVQEPYLEYQAFYNVRRVDVISAESGSDHPELGSARATALDSTYNCASLVRLICVSVPRVNEVLSRTALSPDARDLVIVLVNDPEYGGSGGSVAVASMHDDAVEIILHEMGHSFALLADEYGGPPPPACDSSVEPAAANVTRTTDRTLVKWAPWIAPGTPVPTSTPAPGVPGLYQGARFCDAGLYRPTFNSKMRSLGRPFEQINVEQHVKRIYNLVDPIDDAQPAGSAIMAAAGQAVGLSVAVPQPRTHALEVVWRLDGTIVGTQTSLALTGGMLSAGSHQVTVSVRDRTAFVRSDPAHLLEATRGWNIVVSGTTMMPDKTTLRFAAVTNGGGFIAQTPPQLARLVQSGPGTISWTATTNQPWLTVSPSSGTGPAAFAVAVVSAGGLPIGGSVSGTVTWSLSGSGNAATSLTVVLTTLPTDTSAHPFGTVDTPADNRTGVTGAIPFTGWALDDVGVVRVGVCRDAAAGEAVLADPNCGGAAQIYVADALFIDGARPDVQVAYGTYPRNSQAGWGVMVLTNMLPNQGNGTYRFAMYAQDTEGHSVLLGTRTMTCDNANATLPFGTIDTPAQGETVSGGAYVNFGWALTQNPKAIAADGSTLTVYVDGVAVGSPTYDNYRVDIATLFPGLANSAGAVGFRVLDTTLLANGLHTIVWTATDTGNFTEGLGSRYFTVSNGTAAVTTSAARRIAGEAALPVTELPLQPAAIAAAPLDAAPITGRRGWAPDLPWQSYAGDPSGRVVIRGEELDRFELEVGKPGLARYTGYVRVGREVAPLPIGSHLDPQNGRFTWSPGVGFVGTYDLVFVRGAAGQAASRREVRIVLQPKGHGQVGPQVLIDTPVPQQDVGQPFMLAGWTADLDAEDGTGISTVHVWAYPLTGGPPIFAGLARHGGSRPDVATVYGDQFRDSGYGLIVQGLIPGNYDLAVFAWSRVRGGFVPATVVRVTVR